MSIFPYDFFISDFFPKATDIPFGKQLNSLFFKPRSDNHDFPIHGPNIIRFAKSFLREAKKLDLNSVKCSKESQHLFLTKHENMLKLMEVDSNEHSLQKAEEFLAICALYHDIGKVIRRENHPQIGANLLINYDDRERENLVNALGTTLDSSSQDSKRNRFNLIVSVIKHHDKFGVVSTGEGGLPIFSDILYFWSEESKMDGILKNLTTVMLLNLADIAAVCTAQRNRRNDALEFARKIWDLRSQNNLQNNFECEENIFNEWKQIYQEPDYYLGISNQAMSDVLNDWEILINAIQENEVGGDRLRLKNRLFELERNPARTIKRIIRLIRTTLSTVGADSLTEYVTITSVEPILVGSIGSFQLQNFCDQLATVVKFDYGLKFFKVLVCTCIKKYIDTLSDEKSPDYELSAEEKNTVKDLSTSQQRAIVEELTVLIIRVISSLIGKYTGIIGSFSGSNRRFGFQLMGLTSDKTVLSTIMQLLCIRNNKEFAALTWIGDEVPIWTMD